MHSSSQDINTRKAQAWKACNKLNKIWKSTLPRVTKIKIFQATVESILLYGSETWTVTAKVRKVLDGCYTRLLRTVLDISWQLSNNELYGDLPRLSDKIRQRRLQFAGHMSEELWAGSVGSRSLETNAWHTMCGEAYQDLCGYYYVVSGHRTYPCWLEDLHGGKTVWRVISDVRQNVDGVSKWVSEWVSYKEK